MRVLSDIFPDVVNMSAIACIVILFVLLARLLLKRAPKIFSYALWAIVLVRLLVPLSIPSPVSAIPEIQTANSSNINYVLPDIEYETPSDRAQNIIRLEQSVQNGEAYVKLNHSLEPVEYLSIGWLVGVGFMLLYSVLSYLDIQKKVRIAVPLRENVFIADDIKSPFVIGFIRPKIYLPCNLGEKEQEYIILHEQYHVRRFDHIIKALAFLALTIHWFNPLVWMAFVLASKDMEMSCDEAVIRKLGEDVRADYSASLLTFATGRRIIAGTPLAFGEGNTKGRIRNLANWKRPAFWVVLAAVLLCIGLGVCLLTNPVTDDGENDNGVTYYHGTVVDSAMSVVNEGDREGRSYITLACDDGEERLFWMAENNVKPDHNLVGQYVIVRGKIESGTGLLVATQISVDEEELFETLDQAIHSAILDHNWSPRYEGMYQCASFVTLSSGSSGVAAVETPMKLIETAEVYGLAYHKVFRLEDGMLVEEGGSHVPVVLSFTYTDSGEYKLTEYWEPRDGSFYDDDIRKKFSGRPWPDTQEYLFEQLLECYDQALDYYQLDRGALVKMLLSSMLTKAKFSDVGALIETGDIDVEILMHYGKSTLEYCFTEFLSGGQNDTRGDIMASICKAIISDWGEPVLMIDSDPPMNGQEWFDFYCEQARNLLNKYSQDEILEQYPASWLLLNMAGQISAQPNWGITLSAKNVTSTGLTIVCTQSGGMPTGELNSGSRYVIEEFVDGKWFRIFPKETNYIWTGEAWLITMNGSVEWEENWEYALGELPSGLYRIGKEICDFRETGDYDTAMFFAEFTIR